MCNLGGLLFKPGGSNLQHATALSFLLIVYARYMESANKIVQCGNVAVQPSRLINLAKTQVSKQFSYDFEKILLHFIFNLYISRVSLDEAS